MRVDDKELVKAVKDVLRHRIEGLVIDSIQIDHDLDESGDEIVWVKIIFSNPQKELDPAKTSGLVREMRPRLEEMGEQAFPILSFISKTEYGKRKTAAA